ncbi:oxidative stress survival, Svf1-like protein [Thozetella sp. PMI_491]|nr:oxidative stress survival, Svf1-like protein [Thozetella sp. PMI_491]
MFKWAKQKLADAAGTPEPIHGPEAVKSVAEEAKTVPYTELKREHLKWQALEGTNVESQTFYFFGENGFVLFAQVIFSNVAGVRKTCQFNAKLFYRDSSKPHLWSTNPLNNNSFSDDMTAFYDDHVALELSEDGTYYTIKSDCDDDAIVNLKITRTAPGFHIGETGNTLFGDDFANPWGKMRHAFWPRCVTEGTLLTKEGPVDLKGRGFYVYALQGMKPHHAAAKWNFCNFQGPKHSAILMEYTTPESYGFTKVNVGGIAVDGEIIMANALSTAEHVKTSLDEENGWEIPTDIKFTWTGAAKDGKEVTASIEGSFGGLLDKIDVMEELPGFVKKILGNVAGTRPYIYQFLPNKKLSLKLKVGDEEITEEGELFSEATFIVD